MSLSWNLYHFGLNAIISELLEQISANLDGYLSIIYSMDDKSRWKTLVNILKRVNLAVVPAWHNGSGYTAVYHLGDSKCCARI